MSSSVFMRSASLSNAGRAFGGKSVLATAKGILNRLPSGLTATLPTGADDVGAGARAIRAAGLGAATGGAVIAGRLMGGGATAVGAFGVVTGFGAATALGGAIDGLGRAGGGATGAGVFRMAATFGADGELGRVTGATFGAAGTAAATFGGSVNFGFGTAAGLIVAGFALRTGFSTLDKRFSRVIEAGAGGVTARVGAKAGGTVGRLAIPGVPIGRGVTGDLAVFGRFSFERGIWRGGFAR